MSEDYPALFAARIFQRSLCIHTCIVAFILHLYWGANQRKREGCLCGCGYGSVGMCLYWKEPTFLVNKYGNRIDLALPVNQPHLTNIFKVKNRRQKKKWKVIS